MVVGLSAPPETAVTWVIDLAAGLASGCEGTDAVVVGGDLSAAESISVSVTILGDLAGRPAVTRAGARPGDQVVLAGVLGRAAAGLALLGAGLGDRDPDLVAAQLRPRPPVWLGPQLADAGARAMLDLSDGLLRDGQRLAAASGVDLHLHGVALREHLAAVRHAAAMLAEGPSAVEELAWRWVLAGGEDHGLLACLPPHADIPEGCAVIGEAREGSGRVTVDQAEVPGALGWDHFRVSG
jgi:thiamine-monophosphate kinase